MKIRYMFSIFSMTILFILIVKSSSAIICGYETYCIFGDKANISWEVPEDADKDPVTTQLIWSKNRNFSGKIYSTKKFEEGTDTLITIELNNLSIGQYFYYIRTCDPIDCVNSEVRNFSIFKLTKDLIKSQKVTLEPILKGNIKYMEDSLLASIIIELELSKYNLNKISPEFTAFEDVNFTMSNGKSILVPLDFDRQEYVFEDVVNLKGKHSLYNEHYFYPLDKYQDIINISVLKLQNKEQPINLAYEEGGFRYKANFNEDNIILLKERKVLVRYILGLIVLIIAIVISPFFKIRSFHTVFISYLSIISVSLLLSFEPITLIISIGLMPYLVLSFLYFWCFYKKLRPSTTISRSQ